MKKLVKWIRENTTINRMVRVIIRKLIRITTHIQSVKNYWQVSGKVPFNAGGISIELFAHADDAFVSKLYYGKYWESEVLFWILKFCKTTDSFIDVGANIGFYSLMAAKSNPTLKVFSFEPNPINFKRFLKHISVNNLKNIEPQQMGVGSNSGKIDLFIPVNNLISDVSSVYKGHSSYFNDFEHYAHEVKSVSLDDFCEINNINSRLIKIDVELYEDKVLHGMESIFQKESPVIFCEIFNDEIKRYSNKKLDAELPENYTREIESFLKEKGYSFYLIVKEGLLYTDSLRSSPLSMYLLTPLRLKRRFIPMDNFNEVLIELNFVSGIVS